MRCVALGTAHSPGAFCPTGCQCDIGGSIGLACHEKTGACQCRENVQGSQCNQPTPGHYFPDLHHLRYEVEDGVTEDGRPVRFGYNPLEFENFSWRGYAQMSPFQVPNSRVGKSRISRLESHKILGFLVGSTLTKPT
eukprot:XP_004921088.1 PREDICTED: laminin subunit alpha-3-like [Xenopus tropicalis]